VERDKIKFQTDQPKEENDRLDLYHHIQTLSLGGELHLAPIGDNPQRILDVGTGTGMIFQFFPFLDTKQAQVFGP
jgi:hypothetical protein